jgi:hypothetical protein
MKRKIITLWLFCITTAIFAQTDFLNETENDCYLKNKDEIDARLEMAKEDAYRELTTTYAIKLLYVDDLKQIVEMQEMRKIICDYLQPTDHNQRFWMKKAVENDYRNAFDRIILLSGNDISSPSMPVLFKNSEVLQLTGEQMETLVEKAISYKEILKANSRQDMWRSELELLQSTLTDDQLERFLNLKNIRIATRDAQNHWNRMKEYGLTNDLDSTQAVTQMFVHLLKIQNATDIYAYNDAKKREAWAAIDQYAPLAMRRSYSVSRKNIEKKQGYRGSFNW